VVQTRSTEVPGGTVTILDGSNAIGSGVLDGRGTLTGTLGTLAPGTHVLTAVYPRNVNFLGSTSTAIALVVLAQDFTVTASPSALSIVTEHHAPVALTVASVGGLQDTMDFTCLNLPAHATCTFDQNQMQMNTASITNSVMIDTDDVLYYAEAAPSAHIGRLSVCLMLGGWTLLGAATRRSRRRGTVLLAGFLMCGATFLSGCSGKYPAHTAPGTYAISVEVRGEQSRIVHDAPITLTVLAE